MNDFLNNIPEFSPAMRLLIWFVVCYQFSEICGKFFRGLFIICGNFYFWCRDMSRALKYYNPVPADAIELDINNLEPPYYEELDEL